MPSKKKKYNARFPPARIKKIMQTDEEVGKVAAAVPVIISRALELFIDSLIEKTASITKEKHAKTLSTSHVKQAIHSEKTFDFLRDLVKNVPDHQADDDDGGLIASGSGAQEPKPKPPKPRKTREPSDKVAEKPKGRRGPGRPRKVQIDKKKESSSADDDSEETETDEEQNTSEAEQGKPGPFMSPQSIGVTATSISSQVQASIDLSTIQAPHSSSNISYVETSTFHQMQPAFQPPVQSYPMHNVPIPQYPFPMAMPQCNPSQFNEFAPSPTPALNSSNKNIPQFFPPMMPPYMPPFLGMPQASFVMPPSPQDGPTYHDISHNTVYRHVPDAGHSVSPSQKDSLETKDCDMPLDMSVSGKSRSPSITEPRGSSHPTTVPNQNEESSRIPQPPQGNRYQTLPEHQSGHSQHSDEQTKETNGPKSNVKQTLNNTKQHNNSPKKSAVKSKDFNTRFNNVEKNSVPKEKKKNNVENSIEYENLSSLMNQGSAKIVNKEDDEDYDT